MQLSGCVSYPLEPVTGLRGIGERCNLWDSPQLKTLVATYKWDVALTLCTTYCEPRDDLLLVIPGADLLDGSSEMGQFIRLCATEPSIAKLPFMIDSSTFPGIEVGLQSVLGKSIVNALS